jgi:UDP-glucose 4-epimerase
MEYDLIVGGAGYVGSHVNKYLAERGFRTVVFDNLDRGHREFVKWGEFEKGDLADREALRACFRKYSIRSVMHFSAFTYVGESVEDPERYYRNNVANALNLLSVMREFGTARFIFSSSCAVYGVPETIPMEEDHPKRPVNPYGRTKWMIEMILEDYARAYGLKYAILRYFNAAGADPDGEIGEWHDPETHLIPLVLDGALGIRRDVRIFGTDYETPDGTCIRDYIHVFDLADAHVLALKKLLDGGKSDSFNLGNGLGFSVREVIETARRVTGRNIPAIEGPRREGDPPVLIGSSEKAKRVLGWKPRYAGLEAILETAWKWHRLLNSRS